MTGADRDADDERREARDWLASLHLVGSKGERSEDFEPLVGLVTDCISLLDVVESDERVRQLVRTMKQLRYSWHDDASALRDREARALARSYACDTIRAVLELERIAGSFNLEPGHYRNDRATHRSVAAVASVTAAYAVEPAELLQLLADECRAPGVAMPEVERWIAETWEAARSGPELALVSDFLPFDRPTGGGKKQGARVADAAVARLLNDAMPPFDKDSWALQSRLLGFCGFDIDRKQIERAVIGNQRRTS